MSKYGSAIVLDANILIRAVLGQKVRNIVLDKYEQYEFYTPDICVMDAKKYLPLLFNKRNISPHDALYLLEKLVDVIDVVDLDIYVQHEQSARERMEGKDILDWPIAATALAFQCPIWTEDKDFFGSGFSTWTTDKIHLFFQK